MLSVGEFEARKEYREFTTPDRVVSGLALLTLIGLSLVVFPGWVTWIIGFDGDYVAVFGALSDEILFVAATTVVHECIHYSVARWFDYEPRFGITLKDTVWFVKEPTPYVAIIEQPVSRDDNIGMLIAPFVLISGVAFFLMLMPSPNWVTHYAGVAFVFNTSASLGDIFNCVQLSSLSQNTEFVNVMDGEIRTFYEKVE